LSLAGLFLDSSSLTLQHVDATTVTVVVRLTATQARCPACQQPSRHVHSRYVRKVADLPLEGRAVHIELQVRRFFCLASQCPRQIFAERTELAAAFARTTRRLHQIHTDLGLVLGGEAGARLARRLAMPTSPDTLLRRIRQQSVPALAPVRVLGVDDWALRRGHRYGTILCDLERHRIVDLLPERSAAALCQWLEAHPEVEIISRDRADDYIKGATAGAPQALQVADRWHLLRNLSDTLRRVVDRLSSKIRQGLKTVASSPAEPNAPPAAGPAVADNERPEQPPLTRAEQCRQADRQLRYQLYRQVRELSREGVTYAAIGRRLGLSPATVRRLAEAEFFPERAPRPTMCDAAAVADFLHRRCAEGCHNAAQLFAELKTQGFRGSYPMVWRWLVRRRGGTRRILCSAAASTPAQLRLSPRQMVRLLLRPEAKLDQAGRELRDRLEAQDSALQKAADLGRRFQEMLKGQDAKGLDRWLTQSQHETVPRELRNFATGLRADKAAVRAALATPWSNGQVEGQVNRLKTLKRQMYGRAKFDLLRKRFLLAS
jgi:transposase